MYARSWGYIDGQGCDPHRFQPRIRVTHPKKRKKLQVTENCVREVQVVTRALTGKSDLSLGS